MTLKNSNCANKKKKTKHVAQKTCDKTVKSDKIAFKVQESDINNNIL